jgi:hypothetical protein
MDNAILAQSLANLDAWLESMRQADGYGGPVTHIWRSNLLYCGPMLDWRYEGIITGYLELYSKTGKNQWLERAKQAGLDLVSGQYSCGQFKKSSFERGPIPGGTPHEASVDIALLSLAKLLEGKNDPSWQTIYEKAVKNIEGYLLKHLWTGKYFRNLPDNDFWVANKSATIIEALLRYHDFLKIEDPQRANKIIQIVVQAAESILKLQHPNGGIAQSSVRGDAHALYTARCIWPLLLLNTVTTLAKYREAARKAADFLISLSRPQGGFYQVQYKNGGIGKYPIWVAGCGDILYGLSLLAGKNDSLVETNISWMLNHQDLCGGIRTSYGFGVWAGNRGGVRKLNFSDILHVCGWNDKAFRFLATRLPEGQEIPEPAIQPCQIECMFGNTKAIYLEDNQKISVQTVNNEKTLYHWDKSEKWARLAKYPESCRKLP